MAVQAISHNGCTRGQQGATALPLHRQQTGTAHSWTPATLYKALYQIQVGWHFALFKGDSW